MSQPVPESVTRPGLAQRGKDRTAERAAPIIAAALPAEQVLVAARAESGRTGWWMLLSTYAAFGRRYWYLALTDHHVVLCRVSRWSGRPQDVESVTPRGEVQVTGYQQGGLFSTFRYASPGRDKPLRMRVHRTYRREIESMLGQLGAFGPGPYLGPGPEIPRRASGPARPARPRRAACGYRPAVRAAPWSGRPPA